MEYYLDPASKQRKSRSGNQKAALDLRCLNFPRIILELIPWVFYLPIGIELEGLLAKQKNCGHNVDKVKVYVQGVGLVLSVNMHS